MSCPSYHNSALFQSRHNIANLTNVISEIIGRGGQRFLVKVSQLGSSSKHKVYIYLPWMGI